MKKLILIASVVVALSGCSSIENKNKYRGDWVATDGSRADATIKLSYNYEYGLDYEDLNEIQLSEQQAMELAKKRCNAWGYTGAEPFGATTTICNLMDKSSCSLYMTTKEYQCIGQGNVTHSKETVSIPQQTPAIQYQPIPVAKPVIETTTPTHQNYQQPKPKQPVNDSKDCRYLETDFAIAECVRGR
jgi:hypothetical protein